MTGMQIVDLRTNGTFTQLWKNFENPP